MTTVSLPTIKRLFAVSSNRCAFPACPVALTEPGVTKGKVCHIKGANPTSARYDASQTDAERHHFDNLILLCANHHDEIDDDLESYSVARLRKIKADHESKATAISDEIAEASAMLLMVNSVVSINQSGGITAHTLNLHMPQKVTNPRTAEAIDGLLESMLRLRSEFSGIMVAEACLTAEEIDGCFQTEDFRGLSESLGDYRSFQAVQIQMERAGVNKMDACEIHVPTEMWQTFVAHRALIGRLGVLYHFSCEQHSYKDWRTDALFLNAAQVVAGEELIAAAVKAVVGGADRIITAAETRFKDIARQLAS